METKKYKTIDMLQVGDYVTNGDGDYGVVKAEQGRWNTNKYYACLDRDFIPEHAPVYEVVDFDDDFEDEKKEK